MNLKEMIVQVVYINDKGISLVTLSEEIERRYSVHVSTREIDQIIRKNPELFVEAGDKIKSPTHI